VSFRDSLSQIEDLNGVVLGLSRDTIASHKKFIDKYNLPFTLLSDLKEAVCNLYEVLKEKNMYGKKVMGIERSTFIIDESGIIKKIFRKVKVDGHIEDVINSLKE
jgi:thioredoxin-dependent peroxiredoxin